MLRASHNQVVIAIRKSLDSTLKEEGGAKVNLKVSFGHLEQVVSYHYNSSEDSPVKVFERTQESPYTYQVPAQVGLFSSCSIATFTMWIPLFFPATGPVCSGV